VRAPGPRTFSLEMNPDVVTSCPFYG
jgi:hypothetical protein